MHLCTVPPPPSDRYVFLGMIFTDALFARRDVWLELGLDRPENDLRQVGRQAAKERGKKQAGHYPTKIASVNLVISCNKFFSTILTPALTF